MENDLTSDAKLISTKRLTKVLINIYIVVQKLICYFNQFLITFHLKMVKFIHVNQQECQKNLLNLHLLETLLLIEK